MADVHPTAILEGDVQLGDGVTVGPHCVLTGPVSIGPGTTLIGNVYLNGPLTLGTNNVVYPFACLGFAPQHAKYDPQEPGHGLVIGDGNTFREHVTVHRAFTDDGPTRIGDRSVFMVSSHVGHDCQVGNDCMFVNDSALGGHCVIGDRVIVGGGTKVHQFVRVGHGAMFAGVAGATQDVPPWFMITGINVCGGVNLVGMRRAGLRSEQIDEIRWVYRTICRDGHSVKEALNLLKERADSDVVAEYVRFIESSDRGICQGPGQAIRGMA
jgi:UDP-N-acetylglucosamine acyltransferase